MKPVGARETLPGGRSPWGLIWTRRLLLPYSLNHLPPVLNTGGFLILDVGSNSEAIADFASYRRERFLLAARSVAWFREP